MTSPFAKRLPHIVTRAHLATVLTPTYAAALNVDEEIAHERLERAVQDPRVQEDLYLALAEGLAERLGPRVEPDALLDKLSKAIGQRAGRVKAAEASAPISALMVRINLAIGLAPESMRDTLAGEKGQALTAAGLRELGRYLVKQLVK